MLLLFIITKNRFDEQGKAVLKDQFFENTKSKNLAIWQEEISAQVEKAMAGVLPAEEYHRLKQRQNQLFGLIRNTGKPEFVRDFLEIEDVLEKCRIYFYTLPEQRFALEYLGNSDETITKTLALQNAHANVADILWAERVVYLLELSKAPPGNNHTFISYPSVRVFYPSDWSGTEILDVEDRILFAPKVYGSKLSKNDAETLHLEYPLSFSF